MPGVRVSDAFVFFMCVILSLFADPGNQYRAHRDHRGKKEEFEIFFINLFPSAFFSVSSVPSVVRLPRFFASRANFQL